MTELPSLFPKTSSGGPTVPRWVLDMLDEAFPHKDTLKVTTLEGLYELKGVHHVIEFLRTRSDNPQ